MTHEGSYHVASFASNAEAEIRRLNAQVDLFWPVEGEALLRLGLRDGMSVLDCGCGPGRLLELLQRRLPGLKCTGVEIDPLLVEAGKRHLSDSGLPGIIIKQGSAENPGLPPSSFDFIVMRLVLEHVPDPLAALRSLGALLRPGGRLAIISNDFDFHLRTSPAVPELDQLYSAYCASRRKDGGDPCIGWRVPHLLGEAGLRLVACETELAHNAAFGDAPFLKAEGAGIPAQLVKSGFLDAAVLDAMTASWRKMLNTPGHSIARLLWIAVGERTQTSASIAATPSAQTTVVSAKTAAAPTSAVTGTGLLDRMTALLAELLERDPVKADDTLASLSIDSIVAIQLQERIRSATGVEIPVVRFFEETRVRELVATIEKQASAHPATTVRQNPPPASRPTTIEEGEI